MDRALSLHSDITARLTPFSETPALDASVLLAHVIHKPRTWVIAHPELTLTPAQQKQLDNSVSRLQAGEPLPYVLGHWEFFGLEFNITPNVLIPRPETELLVEKATFWLKKLSEPDLRVADVGTGSGAIAVSIAVHMPDVKIVATDISPKALQVSRHNAQKFSVENRIEFIECDLFPHPHTPSQWEKGEVRREFDLICANLPYISTDELHNLPIHDREPTLALDGGEDGLVQIRKLITLALGWLSQNGLILLEIEASQGVKALSLARETFPNAHIDLHKDLGEKDRLLSINLSRINI